MLHHPILTGLLVLFALVPAALFTAFYFLRFIDKRVLKRGATFKSEVMPKIMEDSIATALYFGLRALGVSLLVAIIYTRFV